MRGLRTAGIVIAVGLVGVGVFSQPRDRFWVQNPTSKARLAVQVILPQAYDGTPLPTLVLVPGGAGDSSGFTKAPPGGASKAQRMADNGFAIVVFDPDGRGRSDGVDDDNGHLQQDGLAAVIEYVATLPEVDGSQIGLVSYSYGGTMAAGALARYPSLPILFFIDWEGPANRNDTGGCDEAHTGHLQGHPCDDENYWRQREASHFALQLEVPYQRLQSARDHAQPDVEHALLMIANATAEAHDGHGTAPWTRLNDLQSNTVYPLTEPPSLPTRPRDVDALITQYAQDLFDLFGPTVASANPIESASPSSDSSDKAVLLFSIGMHIEPMGAHVSEIALAAGATLKAGQDPRKPDYHNRAYFEQHAENLRNLAAILERHGGVMTVQTQSPFTTVAAALGNTILSDLKDQGHEIALHFHEDAHLGEDAEQLPVAVWSAVMAEEIGFIHACGVNEPIRYWSGGNLFPGILQAASAASLDVYSDWKNPNTQSTHPAFIGVNPWRPLGGTDGFNVTKFVQHDPSGPIIFLPPGEIDPMAFSHKRQIAAQEGDEGWFDVLEESLLASVDAASPDRVNAYHFTMHPGEFVGDPRDPLAIIDQFLTEVVDPLVAAGKLQWATFSQIADAFIEWEKTHPTLTPR